MILWLILNATWHSGHSWPLECLFTVKVCSHYRPSWAWFSTLFTRYMLKLLCHRWAHYIIYNVSFINVCLSLMLRYYIIITHTKMLNRIDHTISWDTCSICFNPIEPRTNGLKFEWNIYYEKKSYNSPMNMLCCMTLWLTEQLWLRMIDPCYEYDYPPQRCQGQLCKVLYHLLDLGVLERHIIEHGFRNPELVWYINNK